MASFVSLFLSGEWTEVMELGGLGDAMMLAAGRRRGVCLRFFGLCCACHVVTLLDFGVRCFWSAAVDREDGRALLLYDRKALKRGLRERNGAERMS